MSTKTVSGLLEHCKQAVKDNVQYVYGAKMQVLTYAQIKALQNTYGTNYVWASDLNKAGKMCCDCSGLISSYTGTTRSSSNYNSTAADSATLTQVKANWSKYVGWAFWMSGHIGVVSDTEGYYYAMDGSARNMVHYPISKQSWTKAIKLCDIDYTVSASSSTITSSSIETAYFTGTTTANLNVRKYAGTAYDVLGVVSKGSSVKVIDKYIDGWYEINYNGALGYVSADYVTIDTTAANVMGAINKLADYGCVATKEYWLNNYTNLKYLDSLILNMGLAVRKKAAAKTITDFSAAVNTLVKKGVIKTAEYWLANVNKVEYLSGLVINVANVLS